MFIEAYTRSKYPHRPSANEDRLVVLPPDVFAVIDGVTDKGGRRYGGLTGGQIAGRVIERAVRQLADSDWLLSPDIGVLLREINAGFARTYADLGVSTLVASDPSARFSAQLALVTFGDEAHTFVLVGDAGLRINGAQTYRTSNPGDAVHAELRAAVYGHLLNRGIDPEACAAVARMFALEGLGRFNARHESYVDREAWTTLREDLRRNVPDRFPTLPRPVILALIDEGIVGQARFRNVEGPGGYAALDGCPVPERRITAFTRPAAAVDVVELFTDGYFDPGEEATVASWERRFEEIERLDPAKVSAFPSTKGSSHEHFTDDRTLLVVRPDRGAGPPIGPYGDGSSRPGA